MTGMARRFIYYPDSRVPPPGLLPSGATVATVRTSDDLDLGAWFLPAEDPVAPVLVSNGNAGNRSDRLPLAAGLLHHRLQVLLYDYRGYGGNPGDPTEEGLIADAVAAREHLLTRPGITPESLVYFGESLGAAVMLGLAEQHPPAALVLRSPFSSLLDMARAHLPFVPAGLIEDRWDSIGRIAAVAAPVLVLAGTADAVVPYEQSLRLFEAAPGPKRLITFDGADHNDPALTFGERLCAETARFITETLSG